MNPPNPFFSDKEQILLEYEKNQLFGWQCAREAEIYEDLVKVQEFEKLHRKLHQHPNEELIKQAYENFKSFAYLTLKKSFDEIDSKDDASWKEGLN